MLRKFGNVELTDERNGQCQLSLVTPRQPDGQAIRVYVQRGRAHEGFDVAVQLFSAVQTLETSVDDEMLLHGQLGVNRSELRADTQR